MTPTQFLRDLPRRRRAGERIGIASICSAHPMVLETTLRHGLASDHPVLIEATCNQVNQHGGYTGMTPIAFRKLVESIAEKVGFPVERLILGGDHLGPNPWRHLPAERAMDEARVMIQAYVEAGFTKLHLDTSMGCKGEHGALPDEVTAERAASLAAASLATAHRERVELPVYVIGTEVPTPGGATHAINGLEPTRPDAVAHTIETHRVAFAKHGADQAFQNAIGIVVQPGVEFGNEDIVAYDRARAQALSAVLDHYPQFVFEAHSTDYQPRTALAELVSDGFAILKVGPWLTFALREALYRLDQIAVELGIELEGGTLRAQLEELMLQEPGYWDGHYNGDAIQRRFQRHFSYSDRIRYYWPNPQIIAAVTELIEALEAKPVPPTLASQYFGAAMGGAEADRLGLSPLHLISASITTVLERYRNAVS